MHVFFFNDTATTEIYTLSLHDALPIYTGSKLSATEDNSRALNAALRQRNALRGTGTLRLGAGRSQVQILSLRSTDRKSTRLNSSHANISYAVFCLKKNNNSLISTLSTS